MIVQKYLIFTKIKSSLYFCNCRPALQAYADNMDYSSDYMSYEGYGASDWTTSQYPTQDAYQSIYGSGQDSYGGSGGRRGKTVNIKSECEGDGKK